MRGPQRPQGEEAAEEAPPEAEEQGPPDHVAHPARQPARHGGGRLRLVRDARCDDVPYVKGPIVCRPGESED